MLILPQRKLFLSLNSNSGRIIFMGSKNFFHLKCTVTPHSSNYSSSQKDFFHTHLKFLFSSSPKSVSPIYHRASGYSYTPHATMPIPRPEREQGMGVIQMLLIPPLPPLGCLISKQLNNFLAFSAKSVSRNSVHDNGFKFLSRIRSFKTTADMDEADEEKTSFTKVKRKIEAHGINTDFCAPGSYDLFVCPKCKGGRTMLRSLSFHVSQNWSYALWRCFDVDCGWASQVFADTKKPYPGFNLLGKINSARPLTEESLRLEVLSDELLAYFAERMISKKTLLRNYVMQVAGDKKIIAFTYRQNGLLVGCKYRTLEKRFWQEKGTEKVFYGLDDIAEADNIIIVEGEIDKLSIEESGYYNCVSVPGGAPSTVSDKELPSLEKDTSFQYLWNCKNYLEKASRIVLATDGDIPGQALAEELARRLGRERCWQVIWPKKDDFSSFKDANEVLKNLGADALRDAIDKAKLYGMQNSN